MYNSNGFMKIRKATKKDLEVILLFLEALLKHHKQFSDFPELAKDFKANQRRYYRNLFKNPKSAFFVAEENEKLVGLICGKHGKTTSIFKERDLGEVLDFYVEPAYRNKGIGKKLFMELKKWFKERKLTTMEVSFQVSNKKAQLLYKELGFKPFRSCWRMPI